VNDREPDKNAARQLAIPRHAREVAGNVAMTCRYRYYGISRLVFDTWPRRYKTSGAGRAPGRSKRPAHYPHETAPEVVAKIIYLRTTYLSARRRSRCTCDVRRSCTANCSVRQLDYRKVVRTMALTVKISPRPAVGGVGLMWVDTAACSSVLDLIPSPVTNQVTTPPGNARRSATRSDTAIPPTCGNPIPRDAIIRNRYAW
jgi:hypothetical protein